MGQRLRRFILDPNGQVRENGDGPFVLFSDLAATTDEPGLRAALGKLHHSPRCPAQWRCKSPLPGERGACCGGHGYKTVEERDADIAAHSEIYSGTEAEIRAALLTPAASDDRWAGLKRENDMLRQMLAERAASDGSLDRLAKALMEWEPSIKSIEHARADVQGILDLARLSESASEGKTE